MIESLVLMSALRSLKKSIKHNIHCRNDVLELDEYAECGGYVFSSDHSIPDSVSFENYRKIVELVRKVGKY